jgi:hypothetical protein
MPHFPVSPLHSLLLLLLLQWKQSLSFFLSFDTLIKKILYLETANFNHETKAQLWNFQRVTEAQEYPSNQITHNEYLHKMYTTNNGKTKEMTIKMETDKWAGKSNS